MIIMEEIAMNKNINYFITFCILLCIPIICNGQRAIMSEKRIELSSHTLKKIRKEAKKWEQDWKKAEWSSEIIMPGKDEFKSYTVIPYIKVYPDTVTKEIKYEYLIEKTAIISKRNHIYFWYSQTQKNGISQLTIKDDKPKKFIERLDSIGSQKQYFMIYFIDGTQYVLPGDERHNMGMILAYNENGQDVFIDKHSKKYNSLKEFIDAHYGNMDNYIKAYKEGYLFGKDFIR